MANGLPNADSATDILVRVYDWAKDYLPHKGMIVRDLQLRDAKRLRLDVATLQDGMVA